MSGNVNYRHKRTSIANRRPLPASISAGEIVLNTENGQPGAYIKTDTDAIVKLGPVVISSTLPSLEGAGTTTYSKGELWFDTVNGILKVYDGSSFVNTFSGVVINVQNDPPATPAEGDLWYDDDNADIYIYVAQTTNAWVNIGPGSGSGAVATVNDTAPNGPVNGQIWWKTNTNELYVYNSSIPAWEQVNISADVIVDTGSTPPTLPNSGHLWYDESINPNSLKIYDGSNWVGTSNKFLQDGTNAILKTTQEKLKEVVSVKDFGAAGNGVTDDTLAIETALNSGATSIMFPSGTYVVSSTITKNMNQGKLELYGVGEVILDGSSIGPSTTFLEFIGTTESVVLLDTAITKGDTSFQIPAGLSLSVNDIVEIESDDLWSESRNDYYKGELFRINRIDGSTAHINGAFFDSYSINDRLKKVNAPTITIKNLTFSRTLSADLHTSGVKCRYCRDVFFQNVTIKHCNFSCLDIHKCYNATLKDCVTIANIYAGSGTSYGVNLESSYNVNIISGYYKAGRHGISLTGTYPCRRLLIDGVHVSNDPESDVHAIDLHGNCEFVIVVNSFFDNGAFLSSVNTTFSNNTVKCISSLLSTGIDIRAVKTGGFYTLENNTVLAEHGSASGNYAIRFIISDTNSPGANVVIDTIKISNNYVKHTSTSGSSIGGFRLTGPVYTDMNQTVKNLIITDNSIEVTNGFGLALFPLGVGLVAYTNNIIISNNTINANDECIRVEGGTRHEFTNLLVSGNRLSTTSSTVPVVNIDSNIASKVNFSSNIISGGDETYLNTVSGSIIATHNIFSSGVNSIVLSSGETNSRVIISNNIDNTSSGELNIGGAASAAGFINPIDRPIVWRTAAPTTGTWENGAIVWNRTPAAGGVPGWICTSSGTPGTWKAMANLSA
ncbi:MAG: glycosyl hydrolase family 28-related protein [Nitrososphaeraceae archaeon]|nr:glycosyl hydrolase family 28-related protein [Nitrososphaeraceae archaeon]